MYYVLLKNRGNPDFGQDPTVPVYGTEEDRTEIVCSVEEARDVCVKYIEDNDLGGGNWSGGNIYDLATEELVARISYNGRICFKGDEF